MAIAAGSLVEFQIGGVMQSQNWMNVWTFVVVGELGDATPAEWGEALWNHIKTNYRALVSAGHPTAFQFVRVREMDSLTGEYGEFAIPVIEQPGTAPTSTTTYLPIFNSAGIKFTVSTRLTRPGQKRIPGQRGEDISSIQWVPAYLTKLETFGQMMDDSLTLGAPALGSELQLAVVSVDRTTGLPTAHQEVTGHLVNPYVTSQVSRKFGVGI